MNPERPDVLVVGAGSAGAAAAAFLAEQGRHVVVVDTRRPEAAGARWANGIPGWCFDEAGLARPAPPERLRPGATHGAVLCDATGSHRVHVPADPLIHTDMPALVARLQRRAVEAGAELQRARAVGVEMHGARVAGVRLARGSETRTVRPALAVDASGMAAAVRREVSLLEAYAEPLGSTDLCVAEQAQHALADPAGALAFLAKHGAELGDGVSFMGGVGGFSVLMVGVDPDLREVAVLAGSIPGDGVPDGVAARRAFLANHPWIGPALRGGSAEIPLGPPLVRPTAPGVAVLGDAAGHVYALHGSGVGMGLLAARHLADAVAGARDPGDPAALHAYPRTFLRRYGGRLAAADVFRRFSQTLGPGDLARLIDTGLVTARMMSTGLLQAPFGTDTVALGPVLGALRRAPRLLARVAATGARMIALERLFPRYPETSDGDAIRRFQRAAARLRGY